MGVFVPVWLWSAAVTRPGPRRLLIAVLGAFALLPTFSSGAAAAPANCPTFRVLHDDRVGNLQLPKGTYAMRTSNAAKLSCARASTRFTQFLEDYNGVLPKPWRYQVVGVGDGRFLRGGAAVRFRVRRITGGGGGGGGGGQHPDSGRVCPGSFTVLHNDMIGPVRFPRGEYMITLLQLGDLTCRQASQQFALFLEDVDGVLPAPWRLYPRSAAFRLGRNGPGFRVKPLA
jgi:hypothetical protein